MQPASSPHPAPSEVVEGQIVRRRVKSTVRASAPRFGILEQLLVRREVRAAVGIRLRGEPRLQRLELEMTLGVISPLVGGRWTTIALRAWSRKACPRRRYTADEAPMPSGIPRAVQRKARSSGRNGDSADPAGSDRDEGVDRLRASRCAPAVAGASAVGVGSQRSPGERQGPVPGLRGHTHLRAGPAGCN
jgi:hypothetical protein